LSDPNPPQLLTINNKPILPTVAKKPTKAPVLAAAKPKAKIVSAQNGIIDFDEGTILSSWFQKDL
jgi:hypothetical protein